MAAVEVECVQKTISCDSEATQTHGDSSSFKNSCPGLHAVETSGLSSATTTTIVHKRGGMGGVTCGVDNDLDNDVKFEKLKQLIQNGCSCTLGPERKPCSQQLAVEAALAANLTNRCNTSQEKKNVFQTNINYFRAKRFLI